MEDFAEQVITHINIPRDMVGRVIGRNRTNWKDIEGMVSDAKLEADGPSAVRRLRLRGTKEQLHNARNLITGLMKGGGGRKTKKRQKKRHIEKIDAVEDVEHVENVKHVEDVKFIFIKF